MQAEDIIETINVQPLGQRRLLQAAIEELRRTPAAGPSCHPRAEGDQQPPVSAVEVLRQLGIGQRDPVQPSHPQPPHSHRDTGEPPVPMRSRKPLDIVDFVRGNSGQPERVLYSDDGEQLVLRRGTPSCALIRSHPLNGWRLASGSFGSLSRAGTWRPLISACIYGMAVAVGTVTGLTRRLTGVACAVTGPTRRLDGVACTVTVHPRLSLSVTCPETA